MNDERIISDVKKNTGWNESPALSDDCEPIDRLTKVPGYTVEQPVNVEQHEVKVRDTTRAVVALETKGIKAQPNKDNNSVIVPVDRMDQAVAFLDEAGELNED